MQYCGAASGDGNARRPGRPVDHAPFAETHQRGRKMKAESLHEMDLIAVDTVHREWAAAPGTALPAAFVGARIAALRRPWRLRGSCGRRPGKFRAVATIGYRPLEDAELDFRNEFLRRPGRLHAVVPVQQIPQRLVDAQCAGDVSLLGMGLHQIAAGLFVGRIEIGDGGGDLFPGLGRDSRPPSKPASRLRISLSWMVWRLARTQTRNEGSRSSMPSSSRSSSRGVLRSRDGRARSPPAAGCFRRRPRPDRGRSRSRAARRLKPPNPASSSTGAQFPDDLAERGARLFLVRPAPQQSDQPLAALLLGFRQRKIAKHRGRLARSKFHRPAVEAQRQAPDQRYGKTSRALRRRRPIRSQSGHLRCLASEKSSPWALATSSHIKVN